MGYWGITGGCFLLAEKAQVYGRHDFRGTKEELLKTDCLLAADKMKTSTGVGQTALILWCDGGASRKSLMWTKICRSLASKVEVKLDHCPCSETLCLKPNSPHLP